MVVSFKFKSIYMVCGFSKGQKTFSQLHMGDLRKLEILASKKSGFPKEKLYFTGAVMSYENALLK